MFFNDSKQHAGNRAACYRANMRQLGSVSEYNWRAAPAHWVLEASDCVCRQRERRTRGESTVVCCTHRLDPPSSFHARPATGRPSCVFVLALLTHPHKVCFFCLLSTNARHNSICCLGTFTDCHRLKVNLLPSFHVTSGQTR